jgi:aminocarboxymuconate-semialdehyde decarboxylase
MAIDVHAHLIPEEIECVPGLPAELVDGQRLIDRLDTDGLTGAYISVPPPFFHLEARTLNDGLASLCESFSGRLRPLAYLPIDDVEAALVEAARTRKSPWAGAIIATSTRTRTLADERLEPLWEALRSRFVFVHPGEAPDRRLEPYYLSNLLGNPYEIAFATACLVFSGVVHRHPAVRFCLAHAGGGVAALAGRWQRGYETRRPGVPRLELPPLEALRRLYVDSIAHSDEALILAAKIFGEDHILPGSDWPFPMGEFTSYEEPTPA